MGKKRKKYRHWTTKEERLLIEHVAMRTNRVVLYAQVFPDRTIWAVERRIADLRKVGKIPPVVDCDPPQRKGCVERTNPAQQSLWGGIASKERIYERM